MDVLIHTYHTKYEKDLRSWYSYPTKYFLKKKYPFKKAQDALTSFMRITKKIDHSYDFVLFTRLDILLKSTFFDLVNPKCDKIYFFSQIWTFYQCGFYEGNIPVVNPIIKFIPKKYFWILDNTNIYHDAWVTY